MPTRGIDQYAELHAPGSSFVTDLYKISTTPVKIVEGSTIRPPVLSYVSMCNTLDSEVLFSIYIDTGVDTFYLYQDYPVTKGSTFIVERDDPAYIRLKPSWEVYLVADTADSLDATVSKIVSEGNRIT